MVPSAQPVLVAEALRCAKLWPRYFFSGRPRFLGSTKNANGFPSARCNRKQFFNAARTIQSTEQTDDGVELAPLNYVCEDEEDCDDSLYSELCPRCIHPGDEMKSDGDEDE